jgi:hypothetical protein
MDKNRALKDPINLEVGRTQVEEDPRQDKNKYLRNETRQMAYP